MTLLRNPYHGTPEFGGRDEWAHTWFHGTRGEPDFGQRRKYSDEAQRAALPPGERKMNSGWTQPNQHLGIHFSPLHEVAHKFTGSVSSTPGSLVHAQLHFSNPAVFGSEEHLNIAMAGWASKHYPHWHNDKLNQAMGWNYSDQEGTHRDFSRAPEDQRERWHLSQKAQSLLQWHPHMPEILQGFRHHLAGQGHHGIIYGNGLEGPYETDAGRGGEAAMKYIRKRENWPRGHPYSFSAIAQPEDVRITRVEHIAPWREEPQGDQRTWEDVSDGDEPDEMRDKILDYHRQHGGRLPFRLAARPETAGILRNPSTGGLTWYHGTRASSAELAGGLRPTEYDAEAEEGGHWAAHWNALLGIHFSAHHRAADQFADPHSDVGGASGGSGPRDTPSVVHARLHLANPKHYASEHDMADDAYKHEYDRRQNYISAPHNEDRASYAAGTYFGDDSDRRKRIGKGEWENFEDWDDIGEWGEEAPEPVYRRTQWLNLHPDKGGIVQRFRQRLIDQGHDGIVYGNEEPGERVRSSRPESNMAAIAFHPGQVEITKHHLLGQEQHTAAVTDDDDQDDDEYGWDSCFHCGREHDPHDHDGSAAFSPDWNEILPRVPSVHRSLGIMLPDREHALVHDPATRPEDAARTILSHITSHDGGLGTHWSAPEGMEHTRRAFSSSAQRSLSDMHRPVTSVTLHASTPSREDIEDDPGELIDREVTPYRSPEYEVPLAEDAPVRLTGVSWRRAPGGTWGSDQRWHGDEPEEWKTHSLRRPMRAEAVARDDLEYEHSDFRDAIGPAHQVEAYHPEHGQVGYAETREKEGPGGPHVEISRLWTNREHRGKGIGSALLGEVERHYKDRELRLKPYPEDDEVDEDDPDYQDEEDLRRYYENRGFRDREVPPGEPYGQYGYMTKQAGWTPSSGIFGPTTGLDTRLFGDRHELRPQVREAIMERLDRCLRTDTGLAGSDWQDWLKVYLAGGSASEWAGSRPNDAAQDLDVLIGVNYESARSHSPALSAMDDRQIDAALNAAFRAAFNQQQWEAPFGGTWNVTAFCNPHAWDIRSIRPYAAYDVSDMSWAVRPPHLPGHTLKDFSPATLAHARAVLAQARAILKMPEPLRTREAKDLWEHVHRHRCEAFSAAGEGWTDPGNVDEKYLAYAPGDVLGHIRELALAKTAAAVQPDGPLYHGSLHEFPAGTLLTPEGKDPGGSKFSGDYVYASTTPEAARYFGSMHDDSPMSDRDVYVHRVEPVGDVEPDDFPAGAEDERYAEGNYKAKALRVLDSRKVPGHWAGKTAAADHLVLYHGVHHEDIPSIAASGLRPSDTATGWTVTDSRDGASLHAEKKDWTSPKVVEFHVPRSQAADYLGEPAEAAEGTVYALQRQLPAAWVHQVHDVPAAWTRQAALGDTPLAHLERVEPMPKTAAADFHAPVRRQCEYCGHYPEQHPQFERLYHATSPRKRDSIARGGLRIEFDSGEGSTEPGVYMSPQPGQDPHEDVWEVNASGLRLHPDDPGNMHEFRDVGGSYFSREDISPDRLRLHRGGTGNEWIGYPPKTAAASTPDERPHMSADELGQMKSQYSDLTGRVLTMEEAYHRPDVRFNRRTDQIARDSGYKDARDRHDALRSSIRENGIRNSIFYDPDTLEVGAGHHRYFAGRDENIDRFPVNDYSRKEPYQKVEGFDIPRTEKTAAVPRVASPGSWSPLKAWAATEPHRAVVRIAKDDLQEAHPELTAPLDVRDDDPHAFAQDYDSRPGGELLRRMLSAGGYSADKTARAFVMPHSHPEWGQSQIVSRDGHQGVMLLRPSHWSPGTLAHEAGHMLHAHHAGIDLSRYSHAEGEQAPGHLDDAIMHGPEFARHYATALDAASPGAGAEFLGHHADALQLVSNYRRRVHGLGPVEAAAEPAPEPKTGTADFRDFEDPHKVYLRFGDWPEDERSVNNITGFREDGVSTYELDKHGNPKDPDPGSDRWHTHNADCEPDCDLDQWNDEYGNDTGEEMRGRVQRAEHARYYGEDDPHATGHLVRGEMIGLGGDAEPLLHHVRRVGDWIDHRHLFIPGAEKHRLARDEHDEDYEPPEELPHKTAALPPREDDESEYYHVSPHRLPYGTVLRPPGPGRGNWDEDQGGEHIYLTPHEHRADQYHYLLWQQGHRDIHVYQVHPHGKLEQDPHDIEGLRTKDPVEVVGHLYGHDEHEADDDDDEWFYSRHTAAMTAAADRGDNWIDRARDTISDIAASHGHQLEWTADEEDESRPFRTAWWRGRCVNCAKPKSAQELILPQDPAEDEQKWLGRDEMPPKYLTRKCRQSTEPIPPPPRKANPVPRSGPDYDPVSAADTRERLLHGDRYRKRQKAEMWRRLDEREAVRGYEGLTGKSAHIYLAIPEGLIERVSGGIDDEQHITIAYLGKNVSDAAFEQACRRAQEAASLMYPLEGVLRGVDKFEPDEKGRIPVFVPAYVPGIGALRSMLEDLSASKHRHFRPHVTLGYYKEDEELPSPHPPVNVRFARLFVKRGDQVVSFPLGTQS